MKRLIICSMFVLFSSSTIAATPAELCEGFASYAEVTMKAHQAGVPLSTVLGALSTEEQVELKELMQEIVITAYKTPRYSSEEYKSKAAADYRDKIHVSCLTKFTN